MDLKLILAIFIGKIVAIILKVTGSGATAAPGLFALWIDPNLVRKLSKKIQNGSVIISGTNGKTTTSRLIFNALSQKYLIIHNRQGSNLMRGIASTMVSKSKIIGRSSEDLAVWEVDEATLPKAIDETQAKTIVLLNLFRDQLDRYGEVETTRQKWQKAVSILGKDTTLILNSDDPGIASLAKFHTGKQIFFSLADKKLEFEKPSGVLDIKNCPVCSGNLNYKTYILGHLGKYQCAKCGLKNPEAQIFASNLVSNKDLSSTINITIRSKKLKVKYNLPGTYNAYNVLAAAAAASSLGISPEAISKALKSFTAAFGRFQRLEIGNKNVYVFLIKNPTGANEVVRVLTRLENLNLLVILNDNFADGTDVSWIWDTNWEILSQKTENLAVSGTRAWDMATRLKYANFALSKNAIHEQIDNSIESALSILNNNNTLAILPTYTALMPVEKYLLKHTKIVRWHKQ